jgi:crotonobetainyl-CoA:carnitine CoA-transferase CaiB-like acyl-CoA transferase
VPGVHAVNADYRGRPWEGTDEDTPSGPAGPPPLEGVTVLDLTKMGPGPYAASILGDLGADVLKVEEAGGGRGRRAGRIIRQNYATTIRRNARSMTLNFARPEAAEVFRRLAVTADVVLEGFRPGVAHRLGVGYAAARAANPRIVYCAITGYGQDGPYRDRVGHDINYMGVGGILETTGVKGSPPAIPGSQWGDYSGALFAVIAVLSALRARDRNGEGQYIDISMVDSIVSTMFLALEESSVSGKVPRRGETYVTGTNPFYNVYECADGKYLTIGAAEPWFYDNLRTLLTGVVDLPENPQARREDPALVETLRRAFRTRPRDEWLALLLGADTAVAPVLDLGEVAADPQVRHRQMIVEVPHQLAGRHRQVGIVPRFSRTPGQIQRGTAAIGQHTEEVLRALGYSDAECAAFRAAGVIDEPPP